LTASYFVPSRIPWIKRKGLRAYYHRNKTKVRLAVLLSLFIIVALWPWVCITVPAGHVGVDWYRFSDGTDVVNVRQEGARFIYPWDKLAIYNTRVQEANRDIDVLSKDGMTIGLSIALRFRINPATVGLLHKKIGPDYAKTLLLPAVGSYARSVFAGNSTDEIYAVRRLQIQEEIKRSVTRALLAFFATGDEPANAWVFVDDVLIRGIRFPPSVQSAINRKMEEYQLTQEYAYRLERERLESQRKSIEADGIARFQAAVASDLSDAYLRWRGIEATLALAQSPNAKIVVIGGSKDGLPIILGDGVSSDTLSARKAPGPDAGDLMTRQSPGPIPDRR
jgi:regulator of protease activity HflC (stomatin/prohibitin superfamily)